jgi:hypothetical protein
MFKMFVSYYDANIIELFQLKQIIMREISKIKQNILQYLDFKGVSKYEFYQKTGVSNGVLSQTNGISEESIMKFLSYYTEISPEWLLTGEGSMLKGTVGPKPIIQEDVGKIAMLEGVIKERDNTIKDKDDIIDGLKFKVATLEEKIRANEHDSSIMYIKKVAPEPELVQ